MKIHPIKAIPLHELARQSGALAPEGEYAELVIDGQRFILDNANVLMFDSGVGIMIREGMPEGPSLEEFEGARVLGSEAPTLILIACGPSATMVAKVIRERNRARTTPEGG